MLFAKIVLMFLVVFLTLGAGSALEKKELGIFIFILSIVTACAIGVFLI